MRREEFPLRISDYSIEIVPQPTPDGSTAYFASVYELPGCDSDGTTPEEARRNLEDAFDLYVSTALEDGVGIPEPTRSGAVHVREIIWREPAAESGWAGAA